MQRIQKTALFKEIKETQEILNTKIIRDSLIEMISKTTIIINLLTNLPTIQDLIQTETILNLIIEIITSKENIVLLQDMKISTIFKRINHTLRKDLKRKIRKHELMK